MADQKSDLEAQKEAQKELARRVELGIHVPNPVATLEEVKDTPSSLKKLKVEKVFVNGTLLVKDGGKDHIISIPVNRDPRPRTGDTVEVRFTGEKGAESGTLAKPRPEAEAKAAVK
jgi:hypothetical protein